MNPEVTKTRKKKKRRTRFLFLLGLVLCAYDDITPILIAIPTWDEEVGDMIYDVSVYPKHTPVPPGKVTTSTPHTSTNAAKTGDIQNFGIWIAAAGCGIVIGITIYCIKRKKKHE